MISQQTCPICKSELKTESASLQFFPFCSERCQQVDLFRWTEGRYAIVEKIDGEADVDVEWDEE